MPLKNQGSPTFSNNANENLIIKKGTNGVFEEVAVNNVETPIARRYNPASTFYSINEVNDMQEIADEIKLKSKRSKIHDDKSKKLLDNQEEDEQEPVEQHHPEIDSPCERVSREFGKYLPLGNTNLPFYPSGSSTLTHGNSCSHICGILLLI